MSQRHLTGPETSKDNGLICWKWESRASSSLARFGLGYLSSTCFADVCRLDFLCATCVVTLSRSILWFCRTSSTCLHLREEKIQELRVMGPLGGIKHTLRESKALRSLGPSGSFWRSPPREVQYLSSGTAGWLELGEEAFFPTLRQNFTT